MFVSELYILRHLKDKRVTITHTASYRPLFYRSKSTTYTNPNSPISQRQYALQDADAIQNTPNSKMSQSFATLAAHRAEAQSRRPSAAIALCNPSTFDSLVNS
jgi:hypothetical protein